MDLLLLPYLVIVVSGIIDRPVSPSLRMDNIDTIRFAQAFIEREKIAEMSHLWLFLFK
jgi:hypothetical protein